MAKCPSTGGWEIHLPRNMMPLQILKDRGISSLQVNYAHSDKGGKLWGLTYKSKPEIFTEEWWDLFGWFMKEANKRGMTVSLATIHSVSVRNNMLTKH